MVKYIATFVLLALAACQSVSGRAPEAKDYDPKGESAGPESAAPLDPGPIRGLALYPDDELRFAVVGQPDLSFDAKIPADGSIHYPLIGPVALAGRTIEDIRLDIKERLEKDYLVDAQVTIQVRSYAPKRIYVLGAVGAPREYEISGGRHATLLQAVAQAGGFLEEAARHGVIIYRSPQPGSSERVAMTVDLVELGTDPVLMPNDVVFVPSRDKVYVYGQVARPGGFAVPADKTLTATQAIALAGGYTRIANESNVRLSRRMKSGSREFFVLNLAQVRDGKAGEDRPLQPGDTLFVPESVF
jgi:polysaccharide export outer membrane protein